MSQRLAVVFFLVLAGATAVVGRSFLTRTTETVVASTHAPLEYVVERDPDVPRLPFDDNPDPSQCGIPVQWGSDTTAWLSGLWEGELIQPEVFVYESHLRTSIAGSADHGTKVEIILYQENPVLDYYFVKFDANGERQEGWVPEHFLTFDPVA